MTQLPDWRHPGDAARAQRRKLDWLSIDLPGSDLPDKLEWAKYRLSEDAAGPNTDPAIAIALVAVGDFGTVRDLLASGLDHPLVAARYFDGCGDHAYARRHKARDHAPIATSNEAASFVLDLTTNILGIEPDGVRGRLVLRPRLPESWTRVAVHNIRIADAHVSMRFEHETNVRRFTITQTGGPYPVRLIFEPALVPPIRYAFVDGTLATLGLRESGDRVVAPVQIMLDDTRVVEFQVSQVS